MHVLLYMCFFLTFLFDILYWSYSPLDWDLVQLGSGYGVWVQNGFHGVLSGAFFSFPC